MIQLIANEMRFNVRSTNVYKFICRTNNIWMFVLHVRSTYLNDVRSTKFLMFVLQILMFVLQKSVFVLQNLGVRCTKMWYSLKFMMFVLQSWMFVLQNVVFVLQFFCSFYKFFDVRSTKFECSFYRNFTCSYMFVQMFVLHIL